MTDSNLVWMRLLYARAFGQSETTMTSVDSYSYLLETRRTWRFWAKR